MTCPEPEVADLDFELPFNCGLGTGIFFVALALAVILRYAFATCAERVTLQVPRVRLDHSEVVRTEKSNVAQSRISDRRVSP